MEHKISEKGLLHASQSTNATSQWSEGYMEKEYYMLVGLPRRQVYGARDIRKVIIMSQSLYQFYIFISLTT